MMEEYNFTARGRQLQKERWDKYREAAARRVAGLGHTSINPLCHVVEDAQQSGAFIEVVIWVPRSDIDDQK